MNTLNQAWCWSLRMLTLFYNIQQFMHLYIMKGICCSNSKTLFIKIDTCQRLKFIYFRWICVEIISICTNLIMEVCVEWSRLWWAYHQIPAGLNIATYSLLKIICHKRRNKIALETMRNLFFLDALKLPVRDCFSYDKESERISRH